MVFYMEEEGNMKCRKHPLKQRGTGVCPICLRDRLIRLCPDCANVRPCSCYPTTTSSSSSSSSFSLSSSSSSGIGAIGRVSKLIDSEPAFQRSRSAKFPFLRSKISSKDSSSVNHNLLPPLGHNRSKSSFWSSIFKVQKVEEMTDEEEKRVKLNDIKMMRSRSVGMPCGSDNNDPNSVAAAAAVASDMRLKGRSWFFPSPIKAFRSSKNSSSTNKFLQERSPLCRG